MITQTRGVDRTFSLAPQRARAFLGRPRREGAAIPVEASFDQATRTLRAVFPEPPQPGQVVTLALRPPLNPTWADTSLAVQALPAGPNPVPAPRGGPAEIMSRFLIRPSSWRRRTPRPPEARSPGRPGPPTAGWCRWH